MTRRLLAGLVFLVLPSSAAQAQTVGIEHQPVGCAVADRFPQLEARFAPADAVAGARVLFQTQNTPHWYGVAMKPDGSAFSAALPKPKKNLKAFRYYIEVTDKRLGTHRTADYTTSVVDGAGSCQGEVMAGALASASVLLQVPAGAAALPAGFASTGVIAAGTGSAAAGAGAVTGGGGGLSTAAVVGAVAGAGAAAAAVTVVGGGEEDPTETSYTGPIAGQYTLTQVVIGNVTNTCSWVRALSGTMTLVLDQQGLATGKPDSQATVWETEVGKTGPCSGGGPGEGGGVTFICTVTGTPDSLSCADQRTTTQAGPSTTTTTFAFSGARSGAVISGRVTFGRTGGGTNPSGTDTFSGTATFPVTLQ